MKKLLTLVFAVSVFFCQSQSISIKYMETVDISSEIDAMEMPDDLGGLSAMFICSMYPRKKLRWKKYSDLNIC